MLHGEKEIVVRLHDATHGFSLPPGHELEHLESEGGGPALVRLSVPGLRGATCYLLDTQETDEEIVYVVKPMGVSSSVGRQSPPGYPWTEVLNGEQERLVRELTEAKGEPWQDAWAWGEGHEEHFAAMRAELRRLRRGRASSR